MKRMIAIGLALMFSACGRGGPSSPPSPSPSPSPSVPNVAGTYNGPLIFTIGGSSVPAATFTARMVVVQADAQVTITQTWTLDAQTIPWPAVTGTINATGFFTPAGGPTPASVDPTCGTIQPLQSSTTFSGNTVQYIETDSTQNCGNWTFNGTLTR